ncbi:MAG: SEL1-like repeat protein [Alphaproteobacteria bacterium]|nr:SEL1-like repeat protein [Alphaproteobacteria bacterium]
MNTRHLIAALFLAPCLVFAGSPSVNAQEARDVCPAVPSAHPPAAAPDLAALKEEAQDGSIGSAISLANEYARLKNFPEAEKWYRLVLYKGDGKGALGLYELSKKGAIKLDDAEGVKRYGLGLIEADASKGNGGSAMTMAELYLTGQSYATDYDKAREWFIIAAQAGKPAAFYELGLLHSNGLYHEIAPVQALRYFKAAAAAGIAPATRQVAIAYHMGSGVAKDLDQAIICYTRSAEQGDVMAMRDLGNIYRIDRPNAGLSESWYKRAAALGDVDAHYALGMLYENTNPPASQNHLAEAVKLKHHLARVKSDPSYVPAPEVKAPPKTAAPSVPPASTPEPAQPEPLKP